MLVGPNKADPGSANLLVPAELPFHVPVNPLASERGHVGFGFDEYLLVLTDRTATSASTTPTPLAAWLASAFPRRHVVVVEDATASAWRSRTLRGQIHVDTRTDLQRLMAHAWAVVDLAPGYLIARECIEALRFGIPVVIPEDSAAATLARRGGGLLFDGIAGLIACVDVLENRTARDSLAQGARAVADEHHGDPGRFVDAISCFFAEVLNRSDPTPP